MIKKLYIAPLFSILSIFSYCLLAAEEKATTKYFIITSSQNNLESSLNQKSLRGFFTLKRNIWPDGSPVQIVTLKTDDIKHKHFVETQLKLFHYQVKRKWDLHIFSGSSLTPIEADNFDHLIQVIKSTPGSLGYITQFQLKAIENEDVIAIVIE